MKKRLVSLMLAIMMVMSLTNLSACGRKELADQVGIDTSVVEATEEKNPLNVQAADVACDKQLKAVEAELLATKMALQEANATVEGLNTKVSELTNANADLQKEIDGIEVPDISKITAGKDAEIAALKAEIEALKAEKKEETPKVEVINGVVYCDVDYFIERATVNFVDGTAALKAIKAGTSVVLDDVHAIGERAQYRDNTFVLPRKDYKVAVTFDGAQVYVADFGNYHWATNSLFLESTSKTGYPLTETEKSGKMGNFDQLLQAVAVCVPNKNSEYGYDFYVATGWNEANPVPKPQPQPEKEVVVKTEIVKVEVCKVCGKEKCNGHVETEIVKIEVCKVCGKENCPGHVETEIVKIEVCKVCGKENCPGHVETNTVYVDRVVEKEVIVEVEKEVIIEVPVIVPTPDDDEPENNPDPSVPEKDPCEDPDEGDKEPENNPDPSEPEKDPCEDPDNTPDEDDTDGEKDPCEDPDTTPDEDDTDGEKDPCEDPENNTPEDDTSDEVKDPCEDPENNEDPSKSEDFDPCDTPVDEEVDDPCDVDNSGDTDVDDPCDSDTTEDTDVDDDPCGSSSNVDNEEEEFDPCA